MTEFIGPRGTSSKPWAVRALHFALPIAPTDHVATWGASPSLVRSLEELEVHVTQIDAGRSGQAAESIDHAIVVSRTTAKAKEVTVGLDKLVRPGGGVLIAMPNSRSIRHRIGADRESNVIRQILTNAGFADIQVYGVRVSLLTPQHLVPAEHRSAVAWYLKSGFMPRKGRTAVAIAILSRIAPFRVANLIFPALAIVARRGPSQC